MTEQTLSNEINCASEETIEEYELDKDECSWVYTTDLKKHLQEFKEEFLRKSNRECKQCIEHPTMIDLFEEQMQKHFGKELTE